MEEYFFMQDETKYETQPIAEMTNGIILANYENILSGYCVLPLWLKEPLIKARDCQRSV